MPRNLLRRQSEYIGSHAIERRAPKDAECAVCCGREPGTATEPLVLAECSICHAWYCTFDFTMHGAPTGWDNPRPAWWRRALKAVRRNG